MRVQPSMIERRVLKPFLAKAGSEYDQYVTSWRDTESAKSSKATLKSIVEECGLFVLDEEDGAVIGLAQTKARPSKGRRSSAKKIDGTPSKARKSVEKTPRKSPARGVKRDRNGEAVLDAHADGKPLDLTAELSRLCQMFRKKLKMDDVVSDESGKTPAALLEQLRLMAIVLPEEEKEKKVEAADADDHEEDQMTHEEEDTAEHAPGDEAEAEEEEKEEEEEEEEKEVNSSDLEKKDEDSVEHAEDIEMGGETDQVKSVEQDQNEPAAGPSEGVTEPAAAAAMTTTVDEAEETVTPPAAKRRKLTIIRPGDAGYKEALQRQSPESQPKEQPKENDKKKAKSKQPQKRRENKTKPGKQGEQGASKAMQPQQQQQKKGQASVNQKQQEHLQKQRVLASLRNIRKASPIMGGSRAVTVCVLDTNCLLHHSVEVSELRSYSHILVKIPLAVIRELDGLKTSKDTSVARDARRAINLILNFVEGFNTNFQLQTTSEIVETRGESHSANNDERIIKACLYYRAALSNPVVLVTDDVNLRLKARAFEVSHKSLDEFMIETRKLAPRITFPAITPANAANAAAFAAAAAATATPFPIITSVTTTPSTVATAGKSGNASRRPHSGRRRGNKNNSRKSSK